MSHSQSDRVLALAGLVQALGQVKRTAENGASDAATVQTLLESVFRLDADSPSEVYGDRSGVMPGLRVLHGYLDKQANDPALSRMALDVLQLERRFVGDARTAAAVGEGIARVAPRAESLGATHPDVLAALGGLYADTISHLKPRLMVQGNPHYLAQPAVVAEIRALLLAAIRSAVLWRQIGGSYWDFLLRRGQMRDAVRQHLR